MRIIRKKPFFPLSLHKFRQFSSDFEWNRLFFFFLETDYICIRKFPLVGSETEPKIAKRERKKRSINLHFGWINSFFPSRFFQFCLRNRSRTHLLRFASLSLFFAHFLWCVCTSLRFDCRSVWFDSNGVGNLSTEFIFHLSFSAFFMFIFLSSLHYSS